jgi:16S rRNA (guanine(966)-N(2))-methyltransferase RsmD
VTTGAVHLIGGRFKRSKLPVPDRPGLRPTPDRVREMLFNWLGQDLVGWRVLDAFAGSGALGLEAASRGAAEVTLIERDRALARGLQATCRRLGADNVVVHLADAVAWMNAAPRASFDLVLLDPPFGSNLLAPALAAALPVLAEGGFVYAESGRQLSGWPAPLALHRHARAGSVHAHLLQCSYTAAETSPSAES